MRLTLAVYGHLRHTSAVGNDELTLTFPDDEAVRVRDVLEIANIFEEEVGQILVNGRRARLDTALRGRARLEVHPKEHGNGARRQSVEGDASVQKPDLLHVKQI